MQIAKATDTMLEVDSEMADALEDIKDYTGGCFSGGSLFSDSSKMNFDQNSERFTHKS